MMQRRKWIVDRFTRRNYFWPGRLGKRVKRWEFIERIWNSAKPATCGRLYEKIIIRASPSNVKHYHGKPSWSGSHQSCEAAVTKLPSSRLYNELGQPHMSINFRFNVICLYRFLKSRQRVAVARRGPLYVEVITSVLIEDQGIGG